jgi:hypothetical protein
MKQAATCDVYRPVTATHRELRRVQARAFVRLRLALAAVLRLHGDELRPDITVELERLRCAVFLYEASHSHRDRVVLACIRALGAYDKAVREKTDPAPVPLDNLIHRGLHPVYEEMGCCL